MSIMNFTNCSLSHFGPILDINHHKPAHNEQAMIVLCDWHIT